MPYLLGTDEAGYGPNLGPLVVAATAWHISGDDAPRPADLSGIDLFSRLAPHVAANRPTPQHPRAVWIADSKTVYSPSEGLEQLERGALALLRVAGTVAANIGEFWTEDAIGARDAVNQKERHDVELPVCAAPQTVGEAMAELSAGLNGAGVRFAAIRPRVIFPAEFNDLVQTHGNKAAVLSRLSLGLVGELLAEFSDEPALILCDKHGGRNRYAGLIQEQFDEGLLETVSEGGRQSAYRWGPPARRREIRFEVGAERHLPVAAASMVAKYLRELAMLGFNRFWRSHVHDLKPTAGYPVDARRFKAQIAAAQQALAISDRELWRER